MAAKTFKCLPNGTLPLPPCVPLSSRVCAIRYHPRCVPIVVTEKSAVAGAEPDAGKVANEVCI